MSEPTKAQISVVCLIDLFRTYSTKQGDPKYISKAEMKEMLQTEFVGFVSAGSNTLSVQNLIPCMYN